MTDPVERQREHFNEISALYTESRKHPNHLLLKDLIWSAFFADCKFSSFPRMKVLEPMCGLSEGLQIIKRHVQSEINYFGFDYSEQMVEIAIRNNPGAKVTQRDATSFDGAGEMFDWIILIGGLHHVFAQADDVVLRLASALPRGGYFLNFEPTQNCWATRVVRNRIYKRNALFDEQTEQGFDLENLNCIFSNAGFEKVRQVYPGLLAYILYYNPDAFPAFNLGGASFVRSAFCIDKLLWRTWLAKKLSFATITLWRKN